MNCPLALKFSILTRTSIHGMTKRGSFPIVPEDVLDTISKFWRHQRVTYKTQFIQFMRFPIGYIELALFWIIKIQSNKEFAKNLMVLGSAVNSFREPGSNVLKKFLQYQELWDGDREQVWCIKNWYELKYLKSIEKSRFWL